MKREGEALDRTLIEAARLHDLAQPHDGMLAVEDAQDLHALLE